MNFALFSEHATAVELAFSTTRSRGPTAPRDDARGHRPGVARLPPRRPAGAFYGYRVDGPYDRRAATASIAHKLLIDPYAKAVTGAIRWSDELFGYTVGDPARTSPSTPGTRPARCPSASVVDPAFTWGDDRPPRHPVEPHRHLRVPRPGHDHAPPRRPEQLRGTYLGLASDPVIDHLLGLGVTAVELMPVHQFVADRHLVERGLTNYWGYNSIAFFAPHVGYATGGLGQQVSEFKSMVRTLHRAGLEVILDVVYNHTGEGNHLGPTLSLRGIDNAVYYRLHPRRPASLPRLHRHREQPQHPAPADHGADHGQPALLGHRHARRRFPLRPGPGARARGTRRASRAPSSRSSNRTRCCPR